MSHSPRAGYSAPRGSETGITVSEAGRVETVLGALEDGDCRAILEVTSEDSLTAGEVSDSLDLPLSTAYRKLDTLTEAGLLDEEIRLSRSGKHTSEYVRAVEDVEISMDPDGIELRLVHRCGADGSVPILAGAD